MSWEGQKYKLGVTSDTYRLSGKSKNLQFYDKVISF